MTVRNTGAPMSSTSEVEVPRAALRVSEACAALAISRSKFYEEVSAGRLKALKAGSRTLIPVASIDAWLNSLPAKAA
jgi:excisionase family DNA binding protein